MLVSPEILKPLTRGGVVVLIILEILKTAN